MVGLTKERGAFELVREDVADRRTLDKGTDFEYEFWKNLEYMEA